MGKLRARSQKELNQRYNDILDATSKLFMQGNYEDLSLTSIAKGLRLSRPALYSYFHSKEEVFLELSKREYLAITKQLKAEFATQVDTKDFCDKLIDIFLSRPLFLKLVALHQTALENKVGYERMKEFKTGTLPFFKTMMAAVKQEFPNASDEKIIVFVEQVNVLLPTIHLYMSIPAEQAQVMQELGLFGDSALRNARDFYVNLLNQLAIGLK